ncbi:endolytic transglycosylase MltG [Gryllotalpicola reticulitermitis]|uniref:Endolytic murein transglycosylase n=1 Tax=Gryllotalpicola reticulitermitis TaxID=1184153 RepID=A0ABV8Q9S4_9MICO
MSSDSLPDAEPRQPVQPPPMTRREAREREAREREARQAPETRPAREPAIVHRAEAPEPEIAQPVEASEPEFRHWLSPAPDGGGEQPPRGPTPPRRRRGGRRALTWILATVVILAMIGGGGLFAWNTFQPQVKAIAAKLHPAPTDWTGNGSGSVDVTIKQGDTGDTIAATLAKAGVTRTPQAFYQLLLQTRPDPVFQPGVYRLRGHMSAASALALLQDPSSRVAHTLLIREGDTETTILKNAATATDIPLAQLQAAAKNPSAFGLPAHAKTLEGFLYPATYTLDPGISAQQLLTTLVSRAKQQFTDLGISDTQLWNTLILASIVQKEAGPDPSDLPLIAGVFDNRLRAGMPLQSDATVVYGTGKTGSVWTSDADRANAKNLYNTYVHKGLTPGPISNPGSAALSAALHPQGTYLYFTVVNLKTGQTAFAMTGAEQNANVAKLQAWCRESGNASYCK